MFFLKKVVKPSLVYLCSLHLKNQSNVAEMCVLLWEEPLKTITIKQHYTRKITVDLLYFHKVSENCPY